MKRSLDRVLLVVLSVVSLALFGCQSNAKKDEAGSEAASSTADGDVTESGQAAPGSFEVNGDSDSATAGTMQTVYFAYDSAELSAETRTALDGNAAFLKANTSVKVQIEGHCDERGGIQYNLALGERRAKSVRDYLLALGIENSRTEIVSYGKERPIEFGHDELSWNKNRRANFVIIAK